MNNPWKQYSKLNPQRENGNRQIASDVFHALMSAELSGSEFRIVMAIIDKTWGFNKESDCISSSQLMEMTGLAERTVKESIKILRDKRVIFYAPSNIRVHCGSPLNEFIFNKHYDTWKTQGCRKVHACTVTSDKGAEKRKIRVRRSSPTKETTTKETLTKEIYSPDFLRFYQAYPKKVGKDAALKAWKKRNGTRPGIDAIIKAIEEQKRSDQWTRDSGQYIPNPATWINQGRWDDEVETQPKGKWESMTDDADAL